MADKWSLTQDDWVLRNYLVYQVVDQAIAVISKPDKKFCDALEPVLMANFLFPIDANGKLPKKFNVANFSSVAFSQ